MQDLFVKIINREIPAHIIWENAEFIAFLDISPIEIGHTLVIPKIQTDYIFDLENADYSKLFLAAKSVAKILKNKLNCKRVAILVEGFAVPHCHIHLIPLNSELNLERKILSNQELAQIAQKLTENPEDSL